MSIQLHMIGNRARIEKQILLGRQTVHKMYKNKSRATSHERSLLQQIQDPLRGSPPPQSGGSPPPSALSVDTDAEAAFARSSRFFKRERGTSRERHEDQNGSYSRRRKRTTESQKAVEDEEREAQPTPGSDFQSPRTPSPKPGFFSRIRTGSLSGSANPYSYEYKSNSARESGTENRPDYSWSSESSSDDDYPLDD